MNTVKNKRHTIVGAWALACTLLGFYLSYLALKTFVSVVILNNSEGDSWCSLTPVFDCAPVIESKYSVFLGQPLGLYGMLFYWGCTLLVLQAFGAFGGIRKEGVVFFTFFSYLSAILSIFLFVLSKMVIGTICPICVGMYLTSFACSWVAFVWSRRVGCHPIKDLWASLTSYLKRLFIGRSEKFATWCQIIIFLCGSLIIVLIPATVIRKENALRPPGIAVAQIENFVSEFRQSKVFAIDIQEDDISLGPVDAKVTVVEFADFQCPACKVIWERLKPLSREYEGKIRWVFKNYPLSRSCNPAMAAVPEDSHPFACPAAFASWCAAKQGKGWEATDLLFNAKFEAEAKYLTLQEKKVVIGRILAPLNLVGEEFNRCLGSAEAKRKIERDIAVGDSIELQGTPSFWINGRQMRSQSLDLWRAIIDDLLL